MTNAQLKRLREDLSSLLEGPISPGRVLTTPSSLAGREAMAAAEGVKLDEVLADLGRLAAQAVAADLETDGLRPADFTFDPEIAAVLRQRLVHRLGAGSQHFDEAFLVALGSRG